MRSIERIECIETCTFSPKKVRKSTVSKIFDAGVVENGTKSWKFPGKNFVYQSDAKALKYYKLVAKSGKKFHDESR